MDSIFSFRKMFIILKKELRAIFFSLVAYIFSFFFLIASGIYFFSRFFFINQNDLSDYFSILPIALSFIVPPITMGLFSNEFNTGSYELIYTRAVSTLELIIAKFLSSVIFICFALTPTLFYAITLLFLGRVDFGMIIAGYIGSLFLIFSLCAIGVFASTTTNNQIVSLIISLSIMIFLTLFLKFLTIIFPNSVNFIELISSDYHFANIASGVLDLRDIVYFLSITFIFLYLSNIILLSRKYKIGYVKMNKNIKKIIILLIVLFVISALAFFTTKMRAKDIVANKPRTQIFELNETNVTKYQLNFLEEPIIVEKVKDEWKVTSPKNDYKIDQLEAFANVKNFNTLNIDSIITNLSELDSFGFKDSSNEFTVWEGNKAYKIIVGNKTPDEERYYVKYNDEYFSVEYIYIEALKKTLDMLRDKTIFKSPVVLDAVSSVDINTRDYTNILKKENRTNWIIVGVDGETDVDKIYRDYSTLSLVKASDFVYDQDSKMKYFKYPDATVIINFEDNTHYKYDVVYSDDNNVYVRSDDGTIYEADYSIYDAITRSIEYYLKKEDHNENDLEEVPTELLELPPQK